MKTCFPWSIATVLVLTTGLGLAKEAAPQLPAPIESPSPVSQPTAPPVVAFEKLMAFLPEPPAGWTAEKPNGSTNDIEVFKLSTAARTYQKGEEDDSPVTTITILDAGGHQGYFDITTKAWQVNSQTPEGYDKPVQIDGMPGFEHSNIVSKSSSLWVVVGKRYFVQIEVSNQEPRELREWLKKIDLKKLAELR